MSKRILVVEDQEDNRQIIRDMLSATDYELTEAENGEQALAAAGCLGNGAARPRLQSHPSDEHHRHPAAHGRHQGIVRAGKSSHRCCPEVR
jgi:hypothetical protein